MNSTLISLTVLCYLPAVLLQYFLTKRMAKQVVLKNSMRKKSSQREIRPIWNNVQRVNNKNQFFPTALLTRTGKIPVNTARASGTNKVSTARHDFNRQAVLTSAAMKVNTVKPIVNTVRPANVFYKTHSPFSKPFKNTAALRTNFSKQKVNTAKERIEKTKRSKNDQKPARNGKKTKSQEQDKEFSQKSQPDQPDTVKLSQRKKQRSQKSSQGAIIVKCLRIKGLL
ncbi:hypothetical protein Tco_1521490 [Tanacetum coccineum]